MSGTVSKTKYSYMDLLRLLATFGILFIHTGADGMYLYASEAQGFVRQLYLFATGLSYTAIPIFFMCSGALLLKKEESLLRLFTHRVLRFATVLVLMQAFNYAYLFRAEPGRIYLEHFVRVLFSELFSAHLWYLYSYIAYLLMLPFLRRMVSAMEKKDYHYLFVIYLLFRSTELVQLILFKDSASLNPDFSLSFFASLDIFFYPLLGHYLHNMLDIKSLSMKKYALLAFAALMCMAAGSLLTELRIAWTGVNTPAFNIYRCIPTAALFLGLKLIFDRRPCSARLCALLSAAGNCCFGVYLFENVLRDQSKWLLGICGSFLPPLLACFVWLAAALAVGLCIVYVLKKIPFVKELL